MNISRMSVLSMAAIFVTGISVNQPPCSFAQDTATTPTTTTTPRSVAKTITIESAEVVYVSGDDAVLKLSNGNLRLFSVNAGTPLMIDGKPSKVSDLTPGSTLSHVQMQARTEADVTTVDQFSGRVMRKSGRTLTLRLDDGTSKFYRVPHDATFNVDGRDTTFDNLTTGSRVSITAVKTEPISTHTTGAVKVAQTPQQSGTLVLEK